MLNIGKFILLTIVSITAFVLIGFGLWPTIFIYFTHCPWDCAIEVFSSMLISGVIVGLIFLYFLVKGVKSLYTSIQRLKIK